MTIHRAKGLEFDVVCVADLGRGPRWRAELMRIGRDGRFGLRLAEPGTGRRESALDYRALGEERQAAEAAEERRLFYVAMTRARERLILSGAAKLEAWPELEDLSSHPPTPESTSRPPAPRPTFGGGGPIAWIGPAVADRDGVAVTFVQPRGSRDPGAAASAADAGRAAPRATTTAASARDPPPPPAPSPAARSGRATGGRAQLHLAGRVPAVRLSVLRRAGAAAAGARRSRAAATAERPTGLSALDRGTLVHALLERLDFRRPIVATGEAVAAAAAGLGFTVAPGGPDAAQIIELVDRFAGGELCRRLGRATGVRREEGFRFLLARDLVPAHPAGVLIGGVFDVIAREPGGRTLVVDYKTDRLDGADPQALADRAYGTQRLVYAIAALRAGAAVVEVVHTFLELPQRPAVAIFTREQAPALEARLTALAQGVLDRRFTVTDAPHRGVCEGCPAEGGLCSWPLEMTRREAADRLF